MIMATVTLAAIKIGGVLLGVGKYEVVLIADGYNFVTTNLVRVFELESRGGKLAALRQLLAEARGELVLFTDVGTTR